MSGSDTPRRARRNRSAEAVGVGRRARRNRRPDAIGRGKVARAPAPEGGIARSTVARSVLAVVGCLTVGGGGGALVAATDREVMLSEPLAPSVASGGGAAADDERLGFRRRPYVALGLGVTRLEPESPSDALTVSETTSGGGEIGLGYDVTRWLSAELHAADLGAADIDFLDSGVGDVGYRVFGVSALAYLFGPRDGFVPFSTGRDGAFRREGFSLFGRFGVGGLANESDLDYERDHPAHAVFGAGLEYGFRNGFALRAELQAFDTDARYAGVSVLKRFGRSRAELATPIATGPTEKPEPPAAALPPDPEPSAPPPIEPRVVYFPFDRAELTAEAIAELDAFHAEIADTDADILIGGHTDWIGSERYNEGLSDRRADAVRDYFVSRGIASSRLTARGFGESQPLTTNLTEEGRSLNRRTEIIPDD